MTTNPNISSRTTTLQEWKVVDRSGAVFPGIFVSRSSEVPGNVEIRLKGNTIVVPVYMLRDLAELLLEIASDGEEGAK